MAPRGTKTTLTIGSVEAAVQLYKTVGDPPESNEKLIVRAAPSGGEIVRRSALGAAAKTDPLAVVASYSAASQVVNSVPEDPLVDSVTGKELTAEDVRRGIRLEDGSFVDLTDRLAQIQENSLLESMDVVAFVRREKVPRERIIGSYWIAPSDVQGQRVLVLIREAMALVGRVALVRWTKRTKQSLGLLAPHPSGALLVMEVAFFSRVREAPEKAILTGEPRPEEIQAAARLIEAMADAPVAIDEMEDDAEIARAALIEEALTGEIRDSAAEYAISEDIMREFAASVASK